MGAAAAASIVALITVHMVDGREVIINPMNLTTITQAREESDPHKELAASVQCVLHFTDGGYVSTRETCSTILRFIVSAVPEELTQ